jgi:polyhydroxybutyrate depolymerase
MVGLIPVLAVGVSMLDSQIFEVGGVRREAIVVAPTKRSDRPPIVFGWHGRGGTMQSSQHMYKIETLWPEAVVVYPQGLPCPPPDGSSGPMKANWQTQPGDQGDRDLKFFDVMLTQLSGKYHVEQRQVYTVGFSGGAMMTYVLWSQRNSKLAAAAIAEGRLQDACKPMQPLAAIIAAGKADTTCLFTDQVEAIKYDRQVDGVAPNATPNVLGGVRYFHGSNADLAIMITNLGHQYPPGMSQKVVPFFKAHKKP